MSSSAPRSSRSTVSDAQATTDVYSSYHSDSLGTIAPSDDESINFFRLCRIVLDNVPNVLRNIFKDEFQQKYHQPWTDDSTAGNMLMKHDHWQTKLISPQLKCLQDGNTSNWDSTLLFHVLLHSSMCLNADRVRGTQCIIKVQSNEVLASVPSFDFRRVLQRGYRVIFDLGSDQFRTDIVNVQKRSFFTKYRFRPPQGFLPPKQSSIIVDVYICRKEWFWIEELAVLRNSCFAHCEAARISVTDLQNVVQRTERIYNNLRVSRKAIDAMKAMEREPIASKSVVKQIQFYKEKWMTEHEHYTVISRDVTELKVDVNQLKEEVKEVSEKIIPQTQKEMETMKQELQKGAEVREDIRLQVMENREKLQDATAAKEEVHVLSLNITEMKQRQEQTSFTIKEHESQLDTVTQELHEHEGLAKNQMAVLNTKQTNMASRISHTIEEITQLSQCQKKTNEQVKQAQESITLITDVERQLSSELGRTKEIVKQMSLTEEETVKQVDLLQKYVTTLQTQLQETKTVGKLQLLTSSDFIADVKYYAKQHYPETRKWLFDDIEHWRTQSTTDKVKICLITGNLGMGKSVLASKLSTMANARGILAACFFFQHYKARRNNPKALVQTLVHQFCFQIPDYKEAIENYLHEENLLELSASELFTDLILGPLHKLDNAPERKVIVIDALDECDFEARDELLKLILREFVKLPEWIGVIMTTRPDQKILKRLSRVKPVFELNPNDPRNTNDIKLYLSSILKERMQIEELERGLELMVKKSEGMFLYFHYAAQSILEQSTLTLKDLDSLLPDGIDDYYEQNFRRLCTKLGKEKYQLLLQAITAAPSEFPQAFISPLLNVSYLESAQIVDTISVLLPVHNECISMFHKSIQDWLTDEDLAEDLVIDSTAGHSHVAALCYEEFRKIKSSAPSKTELVKNLVAKYVIEHLVYHLCSAHEESLRVKLCSIITDLQYMYYRLLLSQSSAKDLIDNLSEARKIVSATSTPHHKLETCASFVHRHAQILGSMPELLFQCALNEPQDVASQFGLHEYHDNPAKHFPGLTLYLELINKPQSLATAITEYHCENPITSLTKTPDGRLLICSDSEGKIYIWDKHTGELLQEVIEADRNFLFPINSCSVSPDGNLILFGNMAKAVGTDGSSIPLFESAVHEQVNTCIFSPNGQFVLAWSYYSDGFLRLLSEIEMGHAMQYTVQIWNRETATSTTLEVTRRNEVRPMCACFSHESTHIACGHRDGWIILWEISTKKTKAMLFVDGTVIRQGPFKHPELPPNEPINGITFSRNGHYLAVCYNKGVTIWDAASLNLSQKLSFSTNALQCSDAKFISCSFSNDARHLVAGLSNGYIHVWTNQPSLEGPYNLQLSTRPHGSPNPIVECLFEDDQTIVCALHSVICIYSYDSLMKNPTEALALHPKYATNCAILPDGLTALSCGNGSMCSWNIIHACQIASAQSTVSGHLLRVSADGRLALTFGEGCCIQVWEIDTLKKTSSLYSTCSPTQSETDDPDSSSPQDICHCAVSIHGTVVGGTGEGTLYIWYGESVKVITDHQALITFVEFSYEGDCFVSGDMDGFIAMWKLTDNQMDVRKIPMQRHDDSVEQVIFSPGQLQRIISCGSDNMIHMYNSLTGDMINKMKGHESQVLRIAYSASGELLVSGDGKCQLILWDGFTGQLIRRFDSFSGHTILDLYFTAEDKYICTRDSNQDFVRVYSVSTGTCVSQIDFPALVSAFAASSLKTEPQSHIVCGLKDGSIKFLKLHKNL